VLDIFSEGDISTRMRPGWFTRAYDRVAPF